MRRFQRLRVNNVDSATCDDFRKLHACQSLGGESLGLLSLLATLTHEHDQLRAELTKSPRSIHLASTTTVSRQIECGMV